MILNSIVGYYNIRGPINFIFDSAQNHSPNLERLVKPNAKEAFNCPVFSCSIRIIYYENLQNTTY